MKKRLKRIFGGLLILLLVGVALLDLSNRVMIFRVERTLAGSEHDDVVFVEVDGLQVATRQYGFDEHPTFVLVHGFMGSSYDFHTLALALSESHHIIAIDLIGFGMSDKPHDFDYSKSHQADLVAQVVEALGIDTYIIGGHSMGGEVVLRHAHRYSEQVTHLVLFASAGLQSGQNRVMPRLFYHLIFKNYFIQRHVFASVFSDSSYQDAAQFDPMFRVNSTIPTRTLQAFSRASDDVAVIDLLEEIAIPTLIIYGKEDTWTPSENGFIFEIHLPQSELILLEGVGHMPFIEGLSETLEHVRTFLKSPHP